MTLGKLPVKVAGLHDGGPRNAEKIRSFCQRDTFE
jgi:hypothetical protein